MSAKSFQAKAPETAAEAKKLPGAQKPIAGASGPQPLSEEERALVSEAYNYLHLFQSGCQDYHQRIRDNREIVRMRDPYQDLLVRRLDGEPQMLQLQTLKSTFNNCVADQLDNMPEASLLPERPNMASVAEDMSDVVRFVFNQNGYEELHRRRVEDYFIGTSLTQIVWDDDMDHGKGNVAIIRWPIESFLWDPSAPDIQDARALIKVVFHPMSWYAAHYPDAAPYIGADGGDHGTLGVSEGVAMLSGDEGQSMMLEYWYRRYDSKKRRYTINVAYLAGGALLENNTNVYNHGMYPFVMEAFNYIEGKPVGDGLIDQLAPMMRYVNRYAHYMDENARMSAKNRMLVRKNANLDVKALADFDENVVTGDNIDDDAVRWFQSKPFNGIITQQMLQFQTDIKQDSGQSQWTRGETAGGVTAASAISALQEAGGKITREHTLMLNQGFKKIVEQVLWLVCQFYTERKEQMITGKDGKSREVLMSAEHLRGDDLPPEDMPPVELLAQMDQMLPGAGNSLGLGSRIRQHAEEKAKRRRKRNNLAPPPYTVQVQVSRRNPLRIQAQNELYIQAYTMAAQAGQMFPLKVLFELLVVDGKDRIMPILEEVDQTTKMIQSLQQQVAMLQESNANMKGTIDEYNRRMIAEAQPQAAAQPQMSGQALGIGGNEAALVGGPRK